MPCLTSRLSVSGELLGPDGVVVHTRTIEDTAHTRHHSGRVAQIVAGLGEIVDILGHHVLVHVARFPGPGQMRPLGFGHGWHDDDAFVRLTNAAQLVQPSTAVPR